MRFGDPFGCSVCERVADCAIRVIRRPLGRARCESMSDEPKGRLEVPSIRIAARDGQSRPALVCGEMSAREPAHTDDLKSVEPAHRPRPGCCHRRRPRRRARRIGDRRVGRLARLGLPARGCALAPSPGPCAEAARSGRGAIRGARRGSPASHRGRERSSRDVVLAGNPLGTTAGSRALRQGVGPSARMAARARCLRPSRAGLEREQVVDRLAAADHARLARRDEHRRRARHGVVGRAHRERVGAGRRARRGCRRGAARAARPRSISRSPDSQCLPATV